MTVFSSRQRAKFLLRLHADSVKRGVHIFSLNRPPASHIDGRLATESKAPFTYSGVGSTKGVPSPNGAVLASSPTSGSFQSGAPTNGLPPGYVVDHNWVKLGEGLAAYERAKEAVQRWEMFNLGWVQICWDSSMKGGAPIEAGTTVGVLASQPLWSLNPCRIVYTVDEYTGGTYTIDKEEEKLCRFGFGYGTLPSHVERGEERFQVVWNRGNDSVWYEVLAFSQPNRLLAKIGYPVVRQLQKRFAKDSKAAMVKASLPK